MRSTRPPCLRLTILWSVLLMVATGGGAFGQELKLPDLVLPRNLRKDIEQPTEYILPGTGWQAASPNFRRLYPLILKNGTTPLTVIVDDSGIEHPIVLNEKTVSAENSSLPDSSSLWFVGAEYDLQEGAGLMTGRKIGNSDVLLVESFLPLGITPVRPYVIGLSWETSGVLGGEVRGGAKIDEDTIPYGIVNLNLIRPVGTPDSYKIEFRGLGGHAGGFTGRGEVLLDLPIIGDSWSIGGQFDGGGWYSQTDSSWSAGAALWTGYRTEDGRADIRFGIDGRLNGNLDYLLAPYLEVVWKPNSRWVLYADMGISVDFEADEALIFEPIDSFSPEIPAYSEYLIGFNYIGDSTVSSGLELSGGYGRYSLGKNGGIVVENDAKLGIEADFTIPAGAGKLNLSGDLHYYLVNKITTWDTRLVWDLKNFDPYIRFGSENALFGGGLPGIRSEEPIIGMGTSWIAGDYLDLGLFCYSDFLWAGPSIVLHANWRS